MDRVPTLSLIDPDDDQPSARGRLSDDLIRPAFNQVDLNSTRVFYYFCLGALVVACVLARNFRRSRAGRVVVAVRDNARGAAAFSINGVRAKLSAFAFSGALAGLAGGLYVVGLRGVPFSGFNPLASLQVFTMVVIGGLGSLPGALLGAIYVEGVQAYLRGGAQLFATRRDKQIPPRIPVY